MVQIFTVLLLALLLSGCASQPAPDDPAFYRSHPELELASTWKVTGKIGIKSSQGGANMGFVWKQMPGEYQIVLTGALGTGIANLVGDSHLVKLTLPGGEEYQSSNINDLLLSQLGYPLPVSQLHYWVRGIPDPQYVYKANRSGFRQQGWLVTYKKSDATGPLKIQIEQDSTRVKLVALQWEY